MEDIIILKEFDIKPDLNRILIFLECTRSNPMYDQMKQQCQQLEGKLRQLVQPECVLVPGNFPDGIEGLNAESGKDCIYVLMQLGLSISDYVSDAFAAGNYMEGMILDAMADDYLFQMGDICEQKLQEVYAARGRGIDAKLEAPLDMPMEAHRWILEAVSEQFGQPVSLTESNVFEPAKSLAYILLLSEDPSEFSKWHDCSTCDAKECKLRKAENYIEVLYQGKSYEIPKEEDKSILELIRDYQIPIPSPCSGRGSCGKCRITVEEGKLPITESDRELLDEEELQKGIRLACKAYPADHTVITLDWAGEEIILSAEAEAAYNSWNPEAEAYIGIDIGTTTLAFALADEKGQMCCFHTAVNYQRSYGADVMSRQLAAVSGKGHELQKSMEADLKQGIEALLKKAGAEGPPLVIGIACNTTMSHLLMGYSCEGLGKYPFAPVTLDEIAYPLSTAGKAVVLPGISAYVGGDITAGLLSCGFYKREFPALFIDLGTNAEMAIGTKDRLLVTSAAAGPAFEGGNISCGVGSIPGAISNVTIDDSGIQITTIGSQPPVGFCGTGLVAAIAELRKAGIIDAAGLLQEPYFECGFSFGKAISLTQKDIREFQMAKGAIRAAIEVLAEEYGVSLNQLDAVYLAGGFGYYMDAAKAVQTGLLPEAIADRVLPAGNTSLKGAVRYVSDGNAAAKAAKLINNAKEIHLSKTGSFQERYIGHMNFPE